MQKIALATLLLTSLTGVASAQYDESRLRSSQSSNFAYASDHGTATGYLNDVVSFKDRYGTVVSSRTLGWWCDRYYAGDLRVHSIVIHSNGQISVRFNFYCFYNNMSGGHYEIRRNGVFIDNDPIY